MKIADDSFAKHRCIIVKNGTSSRNYFDSLDVVAIFIGHWCKKLNYVSSVAKQSQCDPDPQPFSSEIEDVSICVMRFQNPLESPFLILESEAVFAQCDLSGKQRLTDRVPRWPYLH